MYSCCDAWRVQPGNRRGILREAHPARPGGALLRLPFPASRQAEAAACCSTRARRCGRAATRARPSSPANPRKACSSRRCGRPSEELKMPRKGKLPPHGHRRLRTLDRARRARSARRKRRTAKGIDFDAARKHWAYQPIRNPAPPTVKNEGWVPIADRCVHPGQAGGERPDAVAGGRPAHADPPVVFRSDRSAADAGRGGGFCQGVDAAA